MKELFDTISDDCSRNITRSYSTSFSLAVKMLSPSIRQDIHNIYGFVRLADEVVDSFHDFDKETLLDGLERDLDDALQRKISINPVLNAFQTTVNKHNISRDLITAFLKSMRMDLDKKVYDTMEDYQEYIYGSADVVGLMCLTVFVDGDKSQYEELKSSAMSLGSAFQKVNFLRDVKQDLQNLDRTYFPHIDMRSLSQADKAVIISEIEEDFRLAHEGIVKLPSEARFGVYTAYRYYKKLLAQLKKTSHDRIMNERISVANHIKLSLLAKSYLRTQLNIL
jgi:phytoene/squalene synthetase